MMGGGQLQRDFRKLTDQQKSRGRYLARKLLEKPPAVLKARILQAAGPAANDAQPGTVGSASNRS
jgi:hypothetical protein